MTQETAERLLTAEDFLDLPKDVSKLHDLVEGRLMPVCAAASRSAVVASRIGGEFHIHLKANPIGIVGGADWSFRLKCNPDTVRMPDVAFVRTEHIPPTGVPSAAWEGGPDLAVEVVSPSNCFGRLMKKVKDYFEAGTRLIWIVDPDERFALVLTPDRPITILGEDGVLDGDDLLPGFTLRLADVWV